MSSLRRRSGLVMSVSRSVHRQPQMLQTALRGRSRSETPVQTLRGSQSLMQRHRQALRLCAVLRAPEAHLLRPQFRLHLLEVVLAPEVDALRGLEPALSLRQIQQLRPRSSQTVSQRISQGTGPCF